MPYCITMTTIIVTIAITISIHITMISTIMSSPAKGSAHTISIAKSNLVSFPVAQVCLSRIEAPT